MPDKTGIMVATALGGGLLLWSGINNKGVLATARDLLQGNRPTPGPAQTFGANLGPLGSTGNAAAGKTPGAQISPSVSAAKNNARLQAAAYGWTGSEFTALDQLWTRESGWRWNATNPTSGAYGIPQSLPADKMASAGADWRTNATTQIKWGLQYIRDRYGSPSAALAHENANGWY